MPSHGLLYKSSGCWGGYRSVTLYYLQEFWSRLFHLWIFGVLGELDWCSRAVSLYSECYRETLFHRLSPVKACFQWYISSFSSIALNSFFGFDSLENCHRFRNDLSTSFSYHHRNPFSFLNLHYFYCLFSLQPQLILGFFHQYLLWFKLDHSSKEPYFLF